MKILQVTQGYWPAIGGTELLVQRVSEELVQQFGDEITVFTTNCFNGEGFFNPALPRLPAGSEDIRGVRIRRFEVKSRISGWARRVGRPAYRLKLPFNEYLRALASGPVIPGLRKRIREFPADVIAASSFPLLHMFDALDGALATGRPCVLHGGLHPDDAWGYERRMIYRAIERCIYIAYTQFEADYVLSRGALPERVFVVGVGVDAERFDGHRAAEAKRRLGFDGLPLVGFIGPLAGQKGVDSLLRAMPLVWRILPDVNVLIAGARTMFSGQLERMVDELPGEYRRKVKLYCDFADEEKPWLYAAVDVLAYPSGYESFGIAFLEAWAATKPVIGCRRGAIPTVIDEGTDGLLVDYQDEEMLAGAIAQLVRDPLLARAMGEAGRRKVLARHTWPRIAREFRRIYQLALSEHRASQA